MSVTLSPASTTGQSSRDIQAGILLALIASQNGISLDKADSLMALDLVAQGNRDLPSNL